jgi:DNA modification methylase
VKNAINYAVMRQYIHSRTSGSLYKQKYNYLCSAGGLFGADTTKLLFFMNTFIHGDCLEALQKVPDACVDLVIMDPPFFSNSIYERIWNDKGEIASFKDRWSGGKQKYIAWLKERVREIKRVMKPTASIFVHCDWHANAEIKIDVMNKLFGESNFINEIIWSYQGTGESKRYLKKKHDTIWYYSMSKDYYFDPDNATEPTKDSSRKRYNKTDEKGAYKDIRHPDGSVHRQYYREEMRLRDVWDMPILNADAAERIGYPTQKPEALYERIIRMASREGDVVLDPFCGGGTTCVAAQRLGRQWIGIDASDMAIRMSTIRLRKMTAEFIIVGDS